MKRIEFTQEQLIKHDKEVIAKYVSDYVIQSYEEHDKEVELQGQIKLIELLYECRFDIDKVMDCIEKFQEEEERDFQKDNYWD